MRISVLIFIAIFTMIFFSCGSNNETVNDSKQDEKGIIEYDLSSNEIPVIVKAPVGAEIRTGVGNGMVDGIRTIDYEIVKDKFVLDINYVVGAKYTKENLIEDAKQFATEDEGFVEFVTEEEMGFIYKLKNEDGDDYNFYYLLLKEGQPIEFCTGLSFTPFTLEQVKTMYEAAKTAK